MGFVREVVLSWSESGAYVLSSYFRLLRMRNAMFFRVGITSDSVSEAKVSVEALNGFQLVNGSFANYGLSTAFR